MVARGFETALRYVADGCRVLEVKSVRCKGCIDRAATLPQAGQPSLQARLCA